MRIVPAVHGWHWLREALGIFGRHAAVWMLLAFAYLVAISVVSAIPFVGPMVFLMTTPAVTLSFAHMSRAVGDRQPLLPQMLATGFRANAKGMLTLGGMYLVCVLLVAALTSALFGDTLTALLRGRLKPEDSPVFALLGSCLLYIPVLCAFWFAPPLTGWHGMSAPKAVFFSIFAAWRNWRAMAIYGIALAVLWSVAAGALILMLKLFGPTIGPGPVSADTLKSTVVLVSLVATPLALAGFALQLITYFTSFRDVFAPAPEGGPPPLPAN